MLRQARVHAPILGPINGETACSRQIAVELCVKRGRDPAGLNCHCVSPSLEALVCVGKDPSLSAVRAKGWRSIKGRIRCPHFASTWFLFTS